jgi:DNA repair photolyase
MSYPSNPTDSLPEPSAVSRKLKALYVPSGRAREYAAWALNLYTGCPHGCKYCFAPRVTHQTAATFAASQPRKSILQKLESDLLRLRPFSLQPSAFSLPSSVHLCFTCDPYQPLEARHQLTRSAIQLLHAAGIAVQILTKAADRASRDFDLLVPSAPANCNLQTANSFGVTLTFADEVAARTWEPNADPPYTRMAVLKEAHKRGIPTWASLEPVIDPAETLRLVDLTHDYVDFYRVGPLNYFPQITAGINWRRFAQDITERFSRYGSRHELKTALRSLLP